jgi:hypothetical protein
VSVETAACLKELDSDTCLDNVGLWERVRIRAEHPSLKAYRCSVLVKTSKPNVGKLLLAEAALFWSPLATRRIARIRVRWVSKIRCPT